MLTLRLRSRLDLLRPMVRRPRAFFDGSMRRRRYRLVINCDAFEHLRLSLSSSKRDLFAMLTAYFDETNTASNQVVPLVAGYLASTLQWSRFNEQWTKLLVRYKVPIDPKRGVRIAHRTDIHRLEGALFEKWTEPHRDEFLGKAYVLIRRHTRIPFGNAVYRKQFEEIVPKKIQKHFGGAYGWCVYSSLFTVKDWVNCITTKNQSSISLKLAHLDKSESIRFLMRCLKIRNLAHCLEWAATDSKGKRLNRCKQQIF